MTSQFLTNNLWLIALVAIWSLPWKGVALWRAAKRGDMWWFVAMLIINTAAILEIVYLYYFSGRKSTDTPNELT